MKFNLKNPLEFFQRLSDVQNELKQWTDEELEAELRMLGIPEADWPRWKEKIKDGLEIDPSDPEAFKGMMNLQEIFVSLKSMPMKEADEFLDSLEKDSDEPRMKDFVFELRGMLRDQARYKDE